MHVVESAHHMLDHSAVENILRNGQPDRNGMSGDIGGRHGFTKCYYNAVINTHGNEQFHNFSSSSPSGILSLIL